MQGPTSFTSKHGHKIHFHAWAAPDARALLVISHGLGEHIRRYDQVAAHLVKHGIAVAGHDWPGHGASSGKRGHIGEYEQLPDILDQVLETGKQLYPELPIFLFGQSMGGNIALHYTLHRTHDLAGMIVNAPWVRLAFEPSPLIVGLGKMMGKIYPKFAQGNGLDPSDLSRDPEVGKEYKADPLVHDRITAGLGLGLMEAAADLNTYAGKAPCPMLLMHGSADRITSHDATQELAGRLKGDVTFQSWADMYHETHNDRGKEDVLQYVADWIQKKL